MLIALVAGEEKDGRVTGTLAGTNQLRGLEAIHLRHFDVEQNCGEIVFQEIAECFGTGVREDQILPERFERGLERDQIFRGVVHHQDLDAILAQLVGDVGWPVHGYWLRREQIRGHEGWAEGWQGFGRLPLMSPNLSCDIASSLLFSV